ncbi:MAG: hypothetical protein ACJAT2_003800 [Bacteriovoracaceae bacterium]|jgi:hypothetical protein
MIAMLLKGLIFYFLFVFIRNIFFGYKSYQRVKEGMNPGVKPGPRQRTAHSDDVLEAEYRVIKD